MQSPDGRQIAFEKFGDGIHLTPIGGGTFDGELATIDPRDVEHHAGGPDARTRILLTVEGEDAERLTRVAEARGKSPTDVIVDLLRDADRPAA